MERDGSVDHNGRRLAWREVGDGTPLLLLQGYAGTSADWDPTFLVQLTASFRVICPDPRGMGSSTLGDPTDRNDPLTVDTMAGDALAVLDALDLAAPVVVVGWSMGGFVAQALARLAPERVRALALLATDAGGPGVVKASPAIWARLVDDSGTPRQQATRLLSLLFPSPLAEQIDAQVGELVAGARAAIDPKALRAQEAAIAAWHATSSEVVPASVPPSVAITGSSDVVIPSANLALIAQRWRGCRTEVVTGAGHALMAQEPVRVAGAICSLA